MRCSITLLFSCLYALLLGLFVPPYSPQCCFVIPASLIIDRNQAFSTGGPKTAEETFYYYQILQLWQKSDVHLWDFCLRAALKTVSGESLSMLDKNQRQQWATFFLTGVALGPGSLATLERQCLEHNRDEFKYCWTKIGRQKTCLPYGA